MGGYSKMINVLSIGNSFSEDAQRYLHELAKSEGEDIQTVNLMISSCNLARHYRNMVGEKKDYQLQANGQAVLGFMTDLKEALTARDWDYITLQQASNYSFKWDSYVPYLEGLAAYCRQMCPGARILLHQTWGYETGSTIMERYGSGFANYDEMFAQVKATYEKAAEVIAADGIIPDGAALQYALHHGLEKIHRDSVHVDPGVGRFILALVWYRYLTGKDISQVKFSAFDVEVSEEAYRIALEAASFAVK